MNNSIAIALDQHDKQKEALAACDASLNFTHSPLPDGFDQPVSRTCRSPRGFRVEIQHAIDDRGLRIYRIEQAADVVRSTATSTDGVQKYAFKATGAKLSPLFNGSEQLVSITSLPFYTRQVFLPEEVTQ